jgi:pantoate--beta-alanine ligase
MQIVHTISEVRKIINEQKKLGKTIGFVPTMGALHNGHLSLLKYSKEQTDFTVISIFVNPIQFGPNEDFSKYPRTLESDSKIAESAKTDIIFAPSVEEMFGKNDQLTFVDIEKLQNNLCGVKRPGHFRGVCTIVSKFFNIICPDKAFFGKKDIQQLYIIKKMVKDLNFNVEIVGCPIVRENNGLALSSRNIYLSKDEKQDALVLNLSIKEAVETINKGENSCEKIIKFIENKINTVKTSKIDYIKIVNETMEDVSVIKNGDILALAVFIGKTRLIDNHIIGEKICF